MSETDITAHAGPQIKTGKSKKAKSETPFYVGLALLFALLVPYGYQALRISRYGIANAPEGYHFPNLLTDGWKPLLSAAIHQCLNLLICTIMPQFLKPIVKGNDAATREKYTTKSCEHIYGSLYFTLSVIYGWTVLKDSEFLYPWLGGPSGGGVHRMNEVSVFVAYDQRLYDYFLITWGFHLKNFIKHFVFEKRGNDFKEISIHHIATLALYLYAVLGNILMLGSIVAYLHDTAEIFVCLGRLFNSFRGKCFSHLSVVTLLLLITTWFGSRCFFLPLIVYQVFTGMRWEAEYAQFQPYYFFVGSFLSVLVVLHYFWFSLFLRMIYRYVRDGKEDDITTHVEEPKNKIK